MKQDTKGLLLTICFILGIVFFLIGLHVARSYVEAQAFNRITGKDVTTWEAMFLELRVDGDD